MADRALFTPDADDHVGPSHKAPPRREKGDAIAISGKEVSPYLGGEIAPSAAPAAAGLDGLDREVAA